MPARDQTARTAARLPLQGRRILVTAGPTWVAVDSVRILTTVFSGETGLGIARHLARRGASVELWLGPGPARLQPADTQRLHLRRFRFYDDLEKLVDEAAVDHFDAIIHSAAVADYQPVPARGKIPSGKDRLVIRLHRTRKLVDILRRRAPRSRLVKFKLEVGLSPEALIQVAEKSRAHSRADLIVANRMEGIGAGRHEAYLVEAGRVVTQVGDKRQLCQALSRWLLAGW